MDDKSVIRAFETINDMLIDRKIIEETDRKKFEGNEKQQPIFCDTIKNVYVIFYLHNKFTTSLFSAFCEDMNPPKNANHLIFVCKDKLTTVNEKNLKKIILSEKSGKNEKKKDNCTDKTSHFKKIEIFCIKNLLFNITKHELVPKHELLDVEDAKKIYERYSIRDNQKILKLPLLITKTDPVAKYYDFKPGNLIKITRPSSSIGEAISYRYCV